MKSLRFLDRRAGFSLGAGLILLGLVVPAIVPTFASAAQLTSRSVTMSTSAISVSSDYKVTFTPTTTGSSEVDLIFCNASTGSLEGNTCTPPSSFTDSSATLDTSSSDGATDTGATITQQTNANAITIDTTLASGSNTLILDGVSNPSTLGTFYLRIETFPSTDTAQAEAAAANPTLDVGSINDFGGVAMSTTNAIGVNADVEETMTFCVSGYNSDVPPAAGCASGVTTPAVNLGTQTGTNYILGSTISTATDFAQISTNAANGAVVNLQSSTHGCGGLVLNSGTTCGIGPQATSGSNTVGTGSGLFGLTVGASAGESGGSTPTGSISPATNYGSTNYYINYVSGDATGVTSPYGSQLLNTGGAPIANEYVPITFGADAAPTTPAGVYTANLGMIAVGTF